jgi:Recombinase
MPYGSGWKRLWRPGVSRAALYLMLKNRIYRGEIAHNGKAFPGEHAAIVDEDLWRRVQSHLEENRTERRGDDKALEPSLLAGIVFDATSEPMTPIHAVKKGTRYRYYISQRLITRRDRQFPRSEGPCGELRSPCHQPPARSLGRSHRNAECDCQWGTRCANAEAVEGRGDTALHSLGTSADPQGLRPCARGPCQRAGSRESH